MEGSFEKVYQYLEEVEIFIDEHINNIINDLLTDMYGQPRSLTRDEVSDLINRLKELN